MRRRSFGVLVGCMSTALIVCPTASARRAPRITSFTATPILLTSSGGPVQLAVAVRHAQHCRLTAQPAIPGLPTTRPCGSGQATLTVTVPANTTKAIVRYTFTARIAGTGVSRTAFVTERAALPPFVTAQPHDQSVPVGGQATFTAASSGQPAPTVQWQLSTDNGSTWTDIGGATSASLMITATPSANGAEYRAVFTNQAGSATTTAATLSVQTAPQITTQPANASVQGDQSVTFSAAASGVPKPAPQWQVSTDQGATWTNIVGATGSSYTFFTTALDAGKQYRAVFTNSLGTATTAAATLTVPPTPGPSQAGYFDYAPPNGETFTQVSAAWTVPAATCGMVANAYAAPFAGIGNTSSLVQVGTISGCAGGLATAEGWYQFAGDSAVNNGNQVLLPLTQYPVAPGDAIVASVSISAGTWTLTMTNTPRSGSPWTFMFTAPNPSPGLNQGSAEVSIEGPAPGDPQYSLANFGTTTFTNMTATLNGQSGPFGNFAPVALQMVTGATPAQPRATPGSLQTLNSFTDTWNSS